jgi:nucleoside-diphosphate-sugar epimerase
MKFFITGANGFIGQNFAKRYKDNIPYNRHDDLTHKLFVSDPDVIVNCAADIYNEEKMWASNVEITRQCLEHVRKNPHIKMIQIGSSSEYGDSSVATHECSLANPDNYYGLSKLMATNLVVNYAKLYNLCAFVVRPYSVFGVGEKSHRLFPKLLTAFKYDNPMELVNGVHDFCYIDDFIDGIELVLNSNLAIPGEIINISNGVETTNVELYNVFKQVFNKDGNVKFVDKFATYKRWLCDNTHIKTKYGWSPKFNLYDAVVEFSKTNYYEPT